MSEPASINDRLEAAAVKAEGASEIMRRVANDPAGSQIPTESGAVPSVAEWYAQNQAGFEQKADEILVDSTAQADIAVGAAAEAGAARDAAQASGNIFPDTGTGLAATSSGQYFSVPSAESREYLILYRNNVGAAQEVKRYLSSKAITDVIDSFGFGSSGWAEAHVDGNGSITYGVRPDGTFSIGEHDDVGGAIPGAQIASRHFVAVPDGSGYALAIADALGNLALAVLSDGTPIVGGERVASLPGQEALFDVVFGSTSIVCWGDSLTEGAGATGGQTYPGQLATQLGAPVINEGFGGQQVAQITARQGGNAAMVTVAGNQIPGSGAVAVTLDMNLLSYPTPATLSIYGYLRGVYGTLTKDTSNNYTFTRATAGSSVKVPPGSPFIVTSSTRNTAGLNLDQGINIFWCGSNDVANPTITSVPAQLDKCIDKLTTTASRKFLILGPIANKVYGAASAEYQAMRAVSDEMKSRWPRNFIDIHALLVEHYDPLNAQDVIDYANHVVPSSLRVDNIHLNNTGYGIVAAAVKSHIDMKGWLA